MSESTIGDTWGDRSDHGPGKGRPARRAVADYFAPPEAEGEIGRLGPYVILKALGRGGMGLVYLARDSRLERDVALKCMAPDQAVDPNARERFVREARTAAKVVHKHVVTIFEADEVNGLPFIAMERLRGITLEELLEQKGVPGLSHVLRITREVAAGLGAAHAMGLVHRDIKPSNIFLEAPKGKVKLIDFGLAHNPKTDTRLTNVGSLVGTPAYMAPEQARGLDVDGRADLFSLGCVLYRLATGEKAFDGDSAIAVLASVLTDSPPPPIERNPQLPRELSDLIMELLQKKEDDRPGSAKDVVDRLGEIKHALEKPAAAPLVRARRPSAGPRPAPLAAPFTPEAAAAARAAWALHLGRAEEETLAFGGGVKLELVLVPPGSFTMGSPPSETGREDGEDARRVEITKPFYLARFPTTQEQYERVAGANPSAFSVAGESRDRVAGHDTARFPVETVSWAEAEAFCRRLTEKGCPCRLPTEAEWEWACRAGTDTPFHFGAALNGTNANCDGNFPYGGGAAGPYLKRTCEVGGYPANAFGLHDMHGNVWQWVADYSGPYTALPATDPVQKEMQGEDRRMLRGGSWDSLPARCRSAQRRKRAPALRHYSFGFRILVPVE